MVPSALCHRRHHSRRYVAVAALLLRLQAFLDQLTGFTPDNEFHLSSAAEARLAIADFFYEPNYVVFVDGPAHTKDSVSAADKAKRRQLKAKGYRLVVFTPDTTSETLAELHNRLKH